MPKHGRSQAATIATIEPRVVAILSMCFACFIAGSWVSDGPSWVRHAPRPAVVTYLVILAAVLIWGCVRGWRIGLRVDHDGVTVRNFFRIYRFSLADVSCFTDGSAFGGESRHWWALCVVLRDGRTVTARGTTRSGTPSPKTLTAIGEAADRCGIQATLTGVFPPRRPAPSPEAGSITLSEWAVSREFSTTRLRPGYVIEEVDAFLEAVRQTFLGIREPSLTTDEIRKKRFSTTRLRPGYDEEEVDAFLNEVELRLAALTRLGGHGEPG
jgi:DivIVA domain-containing protein